MFRLMTAMIAVSAISSFAMADECTNLTLSCEASYVQNGAVVTTAAGTDKLADEHWDEPSEKNCAATAYIRNEAVAPHTSVRIYAQKDLATNNVQFESVASQVLDIVKNGQTVRTADYSNYANANSTVGSALTLGVLHLPQTFGGASDIVVKCVVK